MSTCCHLHTHSEFSMLDGMGRINELVAAAEAMGQPALALTDHGTMSGAIHFYKRAQESSVKPIIGCELYTTADRHEKGSYHHLTVLAENEVGYKNLIQLSTKGYLDGMYYKPRVDFELLEAYNEGLIVLSGCMASELSQGILRDDMDLGGIGSRFMDVFGDRYYLEIMDHGLPEDQLLVERTIELSKRWGVPLVATNDAHYVSKDQAPVHEILLCVQTRDVMSTPPGHGKGMRFSLGPQEFYLKSAAEMERLFGDIPGALDNTLAIAERCNLTIDFGRPHLPQFDCPDGLSSMDYLRQLVQYGLYQRYGSEKGGSIAPAMERADYELGIIEQTGFADYFLLVWDVIRFARERGIAVGPGRGSGAGSIVAYCLFITGVDPLTYGLSFERFLNPERISMPDMDLDFADNRRHEVVEYVTNRYGAAHVAGIITVGTMGVRAGIRDVSRALERPLERADELAKLVPLMAKGVDQALAESPELQDELNGDPEAQEVIDIVRKLAGIARHSSKHAAGVVISRDPLVEHVPLALNKGDRITQYDMASIDALGLLKMDFLGLRTLSIIDLACTLIEKSTGTRINPADIPLDDPKIYRVLASGETFGVFQVDGYGMRKLLKDLQPTEFRHIVAVVALYRPGPMQYLDQFVARRHGIEDVVYRHPVMETVLADTYGIIVYQEQVMQVAVGLGDYTMGQADLLRKAMGKKKPEIMVKERQTFIDRCVAHGTDAELAKRIFDDIEPFAGYAFNRAHATCYAVLTAQTAWIKAHYPKEFMAAVLSCESSNTDKVRAAVMECRRLKIPMLPPDVNESEVDFTPVSGGIRYGLASLPNIGESTCQAIVAERRTGPYTSPVDFCSRLDGTVVNKRVLESLVQCKAMDTFMNRAQLMERLDQIMTFGQALYKARAAGQRSLFDDELVIELDEDAETPATSAPRSVIVDLERSRTKDADIARTITVLQIAQRYPGDDEIVVRLAGITVPMGVRAGYCPEMETELTGVLAG